MTVAAHNILQTPILSEESQIQIAKANQYTFRVAPSANKAQIKEAIEVVFPNVKVVRVNTMNYQGKVKRVTNTRRVGRRAHWKKAIITLRPGDSIDLI